MSIAVFSNQGVYLSHKSFSSGFGKYPHLFCVVTMLLYNVFINNFIEIYMEPEKQPVILQEPTEEEFKAFSDELQALLTKHSFHMTASPHIDEKGLIKALINIFKKVDPKAQGGQEVPPTENGEENTQNK